MEEQTRGAHGSGKNSRGLRVQKMPQLTIQDMETLSRLAVQAGEEYKEKGNQAFHEGRFREAVLCYNNALGACPVGPSAVTYLSNLAATQSKLQQWDVVLQTCARALEMNPHHTKTLLLRARALMNRWNVSAAIATYNRALKVQEDALADARARLEAVRAACRSPKSNGGGAEEERGAQVDTAQTETEKNKLIAALMRDTSLSPQERQLKIHGIRTGKALLGDADADADANATVASAFVNEKSQEEVAIDTEEREMEIARQHLHRALKMGTLLGLETDLGDGITGERVRGGTETDPGGWTATFSSPLIRLCGFERLGQRQNVVYNAQYQASHVSSSSYDMYPPPHMNVVYNAQFQASPVFFQPKTKTPPKPETLNPTRQAMCPPPHMTSILLLI
jgi:tetratricopeptide (TPR) repeat protein